MSRQPGCMVEQQTKFATRHNNISNTKITTLYSRLSMEDERDKDSMSIQNQKAILTEYANKHGFTNIRHFIDDGKTGINFERDGWRELIAEVEAVTILANLKQHFVQRVRAANEPRTSAFMDI